MLALLFLLLFSVSVAQAEDLATLEEWLSGSFSSQAQSLGDTTYFDIRLEVAPIWTEREDGPWLYVEQAAASALEKPYRQRIYQLSQHESGRFISTIYSFAEPLRFAGAWGEENPLATLSPDSLEIRTGCHVELGVDSRGWFLGSTVGNACESVLRGATYATSMVLVGPDRIESWDRGFAENHEQVWGAEKGPYIFFRVE